jgi:uncharacterized protein YtpQ (UPF0354 family)
MFDDFMENWEITIECNQILHKFEDISSDSVFQLIRYVLELLYEFKVI